MKPSFSEIVKDKKGRKVGHTYKRKDGNYDLVLPYKPEIGFVVGNVVKLSIKNKQLVINVYEPFGRKINE